jgi:hypothetical protein
MKIKEFFISEKDSEDIPLEWLFERFRNWRINQLISTDWTQLPDAPVNKEQWASYRQILRDLPSKQNFADLEIPSSPSND